MRWLIAMLLTLLTGPALAEEVVLGLSKDSVRITADFDGSDILIFGAIKREEPIPSDNPIAVVISVAGPSEPTQVYRKEHRYGIWINTDNVNIAAAPSFYAVATSGPWSSVLTETEDLRHTISIPRAIRSVGATTDSADAPDFIDALIRLRTKNGLYALAENAVELDEQTLFSTSIKMPANLTEGTYTTRIFLTRRGEVVSKFETTIDVRKVGLERWFYNLSRQQPISYGILSLLIAVVAGWGASAAFRLLRNG